MGFDLNTAKPVAPSAPATPAARGGFDLASARPVDPGAQVPGGGVAGNRNVGKPTSLREERPTNGVDVLTGGKGVAGDVFDVVLGVPDAVASAGSSMAGGILGALAGAGK